MTAVSSPRPAALLTEKETAAFLRLSQGMLRKLRRSGEGPSFVRIGRAVRYQANALSEWIAARATQ